MWCERVLRNVCLTSILLLVLVPVARAHSIEIKLLLAQRARTGRYTSRSLAIIQGSLDLPLRA